MTVHYELKYRMVGPLCKLSDPMRSKVLFVPGTDTPVSTDDEAATSLRQFLARPWVGDTEIKVIRVVKVTTTTDYEDVTEQLPKSQIATPPISERANHVR